MWIVTAAATVCAVAVTAALVSARFEGGHSSAPSSAQAATVTRAPRLSGRLLVRYVAHVPPYYGLIFGRTISQPFDTRTEPHSADLLNRLYDYETGDTFAHVRQE